MPFDEPNLIIGCKNLINYTVVINIISKPKIVAGMYLKATNILLIID
jgi:hypothetical protein